MDLVRVYCNEISRADFFIVARELLEQRAVFWKCLRGSRKLTLDVLLNRGKSNFIRGEGGTFLCPPFFFAPPSEILHV